MWCACESSGFAAPRRAAWHDGPIPPVGHSGNLPAHPLVHGQCAPLARARAGQPCVSGLLLHGPQQGPAGPGPALVHRSPCLCLCLVVVSRRCTGDSSPCPRKSHRCCCRLSGCACERLVSGVGVCQHPESGGLPCDASRPSLWHWGRCPLELSCGAYGADALAALPTGWWAILELLPPLLPLPSCV